MFTALPWCSLLVCLFFQDEFQPPKLNLTPEQTKIVERVKKDGGQALPFLQFGDPTGPVMGFSLSSNRNTDQTVADLVNHFGEIQSIDIRSDDITDVGFEQLGKLKKLNRILVFHNRITAQAIEKLKANLTKEVKVSVALRDHAEWPTRLVALKIDPKMDPVRKIWCLKFNAIMEITRMYSILIKDGKVHHVELAVVYQDLLNCIPHAIYPLKDRIVMLENAVGFGKEIEQFNYIMMNSGRVSIADHLNAKYWRLEAERLLQEAIELQAKQK
jgi:hypothetical protein